MERDVALHFRDELRQARGAALRDAEAFEAIVFVLERIGVFLTGRIDGLGIYADAILNEARRSPLADDIPSQFPDWHAPFSTIYDLVRRARNDALHEGAFARHRTRHAVELTLVLEDALMAEAVAARDFMVKDPICAFLWQPISSVRRAMLANSFSYLPVALDTDGTPAWRLLSDVVLARYLREATSATDRSTRLARRLGAAVERRDIILSDAPQCGPEDPVSMVLERSKGLPVLVLGAAGDLRGIVTPFDVL